MIDLKKTVSFLLSVSMLVVVFSGCGSKGVSKNDALNVDQMFEFNKYADTSDIPEWKGKQLKLISWVHATNPTASNKGKVAKNDVVTPELKRVTGISYDDDNSYDNAGSSYDVKIAKLIAVNDFPHVGYGILNPEGLIKKQLLWKLDDYLQKYCPNLMKMYGPNTIYANEWKKQIDTYGGIYYMPTAVYSPLFRKMVEKDNSLEGLTSEQIDNITGPTDTPYGSFYMRDDILKKLFPNAKSQKEIEDLFIKNNGVFTKDDILDVPLDKPQDFVKMLYDIKKLGIKEGDREVYPFYTNNGTDNWPLLTVLGSIWGYNGNKFDVNYFTYWDKDSKKVEYTYKQPWFKEILKTYSQLVRDGVASPEALVDNDGMFKEKMNNGLYAITYGTQPDKKAIAEKPYKYRKVFVRYKVNYNKFLFCGFDATYGDRTRFYFKQKLSENDLIQALREQEFMASKPGQKLVEWGPRSAGLFTESKGILQYKDKDLADNMAYNVPNDKSLEYNLFNPNTSYGMAWPGYPAAQPSIFSPKAFYPKKINPESAEMSFDMSYFEKLETIESRSPSIFTFFDDIPLTKRFWDARKSFEDSISKIFTAGDDTQFEKLYGDMTGLAERSGLTDTTLSDINKLYVEKFNKDYMQNLK